MSEIQYLPTARGAAPARRSDAAHANMVSVNGAPRARSAQSRFSTERGVGVGEVVPPGRPSGGFGGIVLPDGHSRGLSPQGTTATIVINTDLVRVVGW